MPFNLEVKNDKGLVTTLTYARPVLVDVDDAETLATVGECLRKSTEWDDMDVVKRKREKKLALTFAMQ